MGTHEHVVRAETAAAGRSGRSRTRRGLAVSLGAAPVLAAACGLGAAGGQSGTKITAPVTIVAWLDSAGYGTATFAPFHEAQLALFRQANPQVTVKVESGDLQTHVVAGTPPDFLRTSYQTMYQYQQQGALEPIDAYLDRRGKADFYDWPREISTIGGKMYEWPWMLNPVGPVVNRSLFKEKNLDQPAPAARPQGRLDLRAVEGRAQGGDVGHRRPGAGRVRHRLGGQDDHRRLLHVDVPVEQRGRAVRQGADEGHAQLAGGHRRPADAGRRRRARAAGQTGAVE